MSASSNNKNNHNSSGLEDDSSSGERDPTGIPKEIGRVIKSLGAKKFLLPEYPRPGGILAQASTLPENVDSNPSAPDMPAYLKLYRSHLKGLRKIKWHALLSTLHEHIGKAQRQEIFKDFCRGWTNIMNKSIEAEVNALKKDGQEVKEEVLNQSPSELAKQNFKTLFESPANLVTYLIMVPLKYPEEIVYEVMCTLKGIVENIITKAPELKDDKGKALITPEQVEELTLCLKTSEAMRKKTGPFTIQLWFWLLVALSIIALIMLAIFTFYYFRR